jgi:hypothetical protein
MQIAVWDIGLVRLDLMLAGGRVILLDLAADCFFGIPAEP